jgi:hypothetical protein
MSSASLCLPSQSRSRRFSARAMDCQYRPIFARDTLSLNAEKRQRKRQNRQRNWQKQAGAGKGRAIEAALAIQALRNATGDATMPRGGKRSTSWKAGQSGNASGSSRTQRELRRQRRNTEKAFVDAVAIQLEITTAAATELYRRGLVAPGHERDPQAVATGVLEAAARYLGLKGAPDPGIPIIPRG